MAVEWFGGLGGSARYMPLVKATAQVEAPGNVRCWAWEVGEGVVGDGHSVSLFFDECQCVITVLLCQNEEWGNRRSFVWTLMLALADHK